MGMPALTVRKLSVATHVALKRRAALKGKSTEAEVRAILEEAVRPAAGVGLGTRLREIGRKYGPFPEIVRDRTPSDPAIFD